MARDVHELSQKLLNKAYRDLSSQQQHVIRHISRREHISRNVRKEHEEQYTFGQRAADHVASFGGSWTFIMIFLGVMAFWIVINTYVLVHLNKRAFDPYPYILLNLVLSMMAGIQAPIIMMSQNRQAAKDRSDAEHDYEVNLKAELEIMALHEKMDTLLEHQWADLITMQKEQIDMLTSLVEELKGIK
ncbi:MAG TPA: DUF1003 domain-containing protein [Desulfomonilia bacterium]|nr:DUF1003 domain-containing protein [Desulfomonilia bacterium]